MNARTAAGRAVLAKFFADRIKTARDQVNADVMGVLDAGDRKGARLEDGTDIGTVSVTNGRKTLAVVDGPAYLAWVRANAPHQVFTPEPVEAVRSAYTASLIETGEVLDDGTLVDPHTGEVVPGLVQKTGDPYVSVKISPDQAAALARALADGRLAGELGDMASIEARA